MAYDGIDDFATAGAADLARALAEGQVSSVELTQAAIDRIERLDGAINAVVVRDFDRARDAAREADAALTRGERGALLGVPMTVKEAFNVAGLPTTWGIAEAKDWIAPTDATVVQRLKGAGAVILGKTNVPPHLSDWQSANPVYGRTVNPHDATRSPGGSSGGSAAALAAGMVPLEFGSDIGGSIRIPAHFCGVVGHKPSYGLVPTRGHAPPGLDGVALPLGVVGPLARKVEDLELALEVTAGPEDEEAVGYRAHLPPPRHAHLGDFRVLVMDSHPLAKVDGEIRGAIDVLAGQVDRAGATVERQTNLLPDLVEAHGGYMRLLMTAMTYGGPPSPDTPSAHAYLNMLNHQLRLRRQWAELFKAFDVVIAPALGVPAFPHIGEDTDLTNAWADRRLMIDGKPEPFADQLAFPGLATYPELPATAVPIAKSRGGLPVGVQILGPYLEDGTCLAFARMIEGL
jgi:amidase